ncbi:MAG TPA: L,D-transpeptidase family protein [Geobacteraceae bacterium]|nr:L,D-transpeptidase family protein [Geobacteraceae bacterium]
MRIAVGTIMVVQLSLLLLLAAGNVEAAGKAAVPTPYRTAANIKLRELQADAPWKFPEEWSSLSVTIAAAEKKHNEGDETEAERIYHLALLKVELLADRVRRGAEDEPVSSEPVSPVPDQDGGAADGSASAYDAVTTADEAGVTASGSGDGEQPDGAFGHATRQIRSKRIVGGEGVYSVRRNDTLRLVSSRLGVNLRELARMNGLKTDSPLWTGQKLRYNNRRIVPKTLANGIVVNIPEKSLYLFKRGRLAATYPVAVGMARKTDRAAWRTPTGRFRVVAKKENPTWTVPLSIRKEMKTQGEKVVEFVPPGPRNPLGRYAITTSLSGIMIHGTTKPTSINTFSSHGCIRVMPEHIDDLFRSVSIAMPGEIIYQPVKVAVTGDGRVFLEVNQDVYGQIEDIRAEVERQLRRHNAEEMVSWNRVTQVVRAQKGIAEEITLQ